MLAAAMNRPSSVAASSPSVVAIYTHEHDWSFVVAGANRDAIVSDFRAAVEKAIADGTTLETFRKDFDAIVATHGWDYNGGRNWRSRVIYETNLNTSYAAGRHEQLQAAPFWQYVHADWVTNPRHQHLAWDGLVLARDDPWWQTHYPPNGWGCQCSVRGLWPRDLRKMGREGPDEAPEVNWIEREVGKLNPNGPRRVRVPEGIAPGFEYIPGASRQREEARKAMQAAALPALAIESSPQTLVKRQQALGFPTGEGWELQEHELKFYERFTNLGEQVRLIQRSAVGLPTNDFLWIGPGWEMEAKKPKKPAYASIARLVRDAVRKARDNHGARKGRFIIDLDNKSLTNKLRAQLGAYNINNPGNEITTLWVLPRAGLEEIALQKKA